MCDLIKLCFLAPRPFTELSFIMSKSEYSNVVEIKYLHILVQEFAISIDNGLINAILSLFSTESIMHVCIYII